MSLRPGGGGGRRRGHEAPPEHNFNLKIISYGHVNGPLDVADDAANRVKLQYSVRDVPNPPSLLRKKHTGASRRMQKEIFGSKLGKARLEQILDAIESKMVEMTEDYSRAPTPEIVTAQDLYRAKESPRELVVAIMCEQGRHRSVAFVEVLGRSVGKKPKWIVECQHRDLDPIGSSEDEDEDDEIDDEDGEEVDEDDFYTSSSNPNPNHVPNGNTSPISGRKLSNSSSHSNHSNSGNNKTAKQKDKERKKMLGRRISSAMVVE